MVQITTSSPPSVRKNNDLWAEAALRLTDRDRLAVNFSCDDKLKILSDLRNETEKAKQQCIAKRWRYTRKTGETVILRDVFTKVIKWVDLFREIGDNAVAYDPAHAALPWAGVRFLLKLAVNDIEKYAFVVEGASTISQMICRQAIFEDVYLQRESSVTQSLIEALIDLYAEAMIYLSNAKSYFDSSTAKRILTSGLLGKSELEDHLTSIRKKEDNVYRYTSLINAEVQMSEYGTMTRLLENMEGPLIRMSDDLKNVRDHYDESKRKDILHWISPQPYPQHHYQTRKGVVAGTGRWLLEDPVFRNWKEESTSSILWLHGIPGSGKSKLASIIIEDAMKLYKDSKHPAPAFFYCSRTPTEPERSNPEVILASIVRQLSCVDADCGLLDPIVQMVETRNRAGFSTVPLTLEESCELIIELSEYYPVTTIIIDALDECDPEKRSDLLEALGTILSRSPQLVKIFVTSRDDQGITWSLQNYPNIRLSSSRNTVDISAFVRTEVESLVQRGKLLRFSQSKDELKSLIIKKIVKGANGMFRWASLQLQMLQNMGTDAIKERLGKLPPTLAQTYDEIHKKFGQYPAEAERTIARNVLVWLLCSQQVLKSNEFLSIISISPHTWLTEVSRDLVLQLCCDFVIYDSELDIFRFAHLSVREFLEERPDYDTASTNALAAEACLLALISASVHPKADEFLLTNDYIKGYKEKLDSRTLDFSYAWETTQRYSWIVLSLDMYSKIYWPIHCQLAANRLGSGTLKTLFDYFMSPNIDSTWPYNAWFGCMDRWILRDLKFDLREKLLSSGPDPLFAACAFDFIDYTKTRILDKSLPDLENTEGSSALHIAMRFNSLRVMSTLLKCPEISIAGEVVYNAARMTTSVMKLLLDLRGHQINISSDVLNAAARNVAMLELILDTFGDRVELTEKVLVFAVGNNTDTLKLLLARLPHQTEAFLLPEVLNAAYRSPDMLLLVLRTAGDKFKLTEDVLVSAAETNALALQVLLERFPHQVRKLVVQSATQGEKKSLLAVLKSSKFDVDWKSTSGRTTLYSAAAHGHKHVTRTLLEYGANPHLGDESGETPLMVARKQGHQEVVSLLEDHIRANHWVTKGEFTSWCPDCLKRYLSEKGHIFCSQCHKDLPDSSEYRITIFDNPSSDTRAEKHPRQHSDEEHAQCQGSFSNPTYLICHACTTRRVTVPASFRRWVAHSAARKFYQKERR